MNRKNWLTLAFLLNFMYILPLPPVGWGGYSENYTGKQSVVLIFDNIEGSTKCRYINWDDPLAPLPVDDPNWTTWETCTEQRYWLLSQIEGQKTVFAEINFTASSRTENDSIYYIASGCGMDPTPPVPGAVYDGDFTNNNHTISFSWQASNDPEQATLEIPLEYQYLVFHNQDTDVSYLGYDLITFFPFDKDSDGSTTRDYSRTGNYGTVNGAVFQSAVGIIAGSYRFNGGQTIFYGPSTDNASEEYSAAAWFRLSSNFGSSSPTTLPIIGRYNSANSNMVMGLSGTDNSHGFAGSLYFKLENPTNNYIIVESARNSWLQNTWYFAVVTFNGTNAWLYIDGELEATSGSDNGDPTWSGFPAGSDLIGGVRIEECSNNWKYFSGNIDEVRQYNRVLTQQEISSLYYNGLSGGNIIGTGTTQYFTGSATDLNIPHNTSVYVNLTTWNCANRSVTVVSDGLVIDLEVPYNPSILSSMYRNITTGQWNDLSPNKWEYAKDLNFSWRAIDPFINSLSGISAYSYLLTKEDELEPDQIPEGEIGNFEKFNNTVLLNVPSGRLHFRVRARDKAGNWGPYSEFNASIDNTPPSKPELLSQEFDVVTHNITYVWSQSQDSESSVVGYMINITSLSGSWSLATTGTTIDFTAPATEEYKAIIGAINGVGIWRWSNEKNVQTDFDPPIITAKPNGNVAGEEISIVANTNEIASCTYDYSGETAFKYTNSTYHESILNAIPGPHSVDITCTDLAGNSDTIQIIFNVATRAVDNIILPPNVNGYSNVLTSMTFQAENSGLPLGEVKDIVIRIDEDEIDATIIDSGNGDYEAFFIVDEIGTYTLEVEADGIVEGPITLTVNPLLLNIEYSGILNAPIKKNYIVYDENSTIRYGIATEFKDQLTFTGSGLNADVDINDHAYVFAGGYTGNMDERDKLIQKGEFEKISNPNFGGNIKNYNYVNLILKYPGLKINADEWSYSPGSYNLLFRNSKINAESVIIVSETEDPGKKTVIHYD